MIYIILVLKIFEIVGQTDRDKETAQENATETAQVELARGAVRGRRRDRRGLQGYRVRTTLRT